jgi:AcrR family transcriptional regulator
VPGDSTQPSARRQELLDAAYQYVLGHGLADVSLRPLAEAIGSSPRVLLYLFGSKEGLIRALLKRARQDELEMLSSIQTETAGPDATVDALWDWLRAPEHRPVLALWVEAYARSLNTSEGPWAGFARSTVDDWLAILATADPTDASDDRPTATQQTATLAILRGALLDLLATGDDARVTAAVHAHLHTLSSVRR